jgi:predicted flap endonuclease-1-like 5' DNA nuclease
MTNENNTAFDDDNATANASAGRAEWPQRFGKMTKLDIKTGRTGDYGIVTVDCGGKFTQTAFIFNAAALEKAKAAAVKAHAAGVQADVWMKGPIESVERGGFSKDEMKVVYFKDNTEYDAPAAAADDAPVAEEAPVAQDMTALKGIGDAVAAVLTENGVTTYAALAASSVEDLEAMAKGYGARATRYGWIEQAQEMTAEAVAA